MKNYLLQVKNLISDHRLEALKKKFEENKICGVNVKQGEIEMIDKLNPANIRNIITVLHNAGFELLDNRKKNICKKIKKLLKTFIHEENEERWENFKCSEFILNNIELNYCYCYLSYVFSFTEGITIERFFQEQKIERVKELFIFDDLTLCEIANQLGYSSVHHLSNQFRKITTLSPSQFKKYIITPPPPRLQRYRII